MRYFTGSDFDRSVSDRGRIVVFTQKELCQKERKEIIDSSTEMLSLADNSRKLKVVKHRGGAVSLLKSTQLRHWKHRLGVTLNTKKSRWYVLPVAEIRNQVELSGVDYIPQVKAFGFSTNRFGLVRNVLVVTAFKENACTLGEYVSGQMGRIDAALVCAFELIKRHVDDGYIHLDLWMENILLDKKLEKSWLIDVECFSLKSKSLPEVRLGFCLGYLFRVHLNKHISRSDYDDLVRSWMAGLPDYDIDRVMSVSDWAALNEISRKTRINIFSLGLEEFAG